MPGAGSPLWAPGGRAPQCELFLFRLPRTTESAVRQSRVLFVSSVGGGGGGGGGKQGRKLLNLDNCQHFAITDHNEWEHPLGVVTNNAVVQDPRLRQCLRPTGCRHATVRSNSPEHPWWGLGGHPHPWVCGGGASPPTHGGWGGGHLPARPSVAGRAWAGISPPRTRGAKSTVGLSADRGWRKQGCASLGVAPHGYFGATSVLLPCYFRATPVLLPCSFRATSVLLPCYFRATSVLLPCYFRAPSLLLPCYFRAPSVLLPSYFRATSVLLP